MRTIAALAMLLLLAVPAHAYDIAELQRDMRAHIDKMMKEVGDVTLEQEATFEGASSLSGMKATTYVKGDRWRSEAMMKGSGKSPDMEVTTLYDGTDVWSVVMGMKHRMPAGALGQAGPTSLWNEFPEDAEVLGEETVNGRAAWKVRYATPKGAPGGQGPTTAWVDKSTFMPIQIETKSSGKPVRMVMSDFRKVKGFEVAHLTEMFTDGEKTMTMKLVGIETNKGLSDDLFDAEKLSGGEGMDMNAMMKKALEMQKRAEQGKGNE